MLASVGAIVVGAILGRLLDRSGFSLARAFQWGRIQGDGDAFRAYWLALALLWLLAAVAPRAFSRDYSQALLISPLAAMLAGFVAGLALRMLDADPQSLAVGAGRFRPVAWIGLTGWIVGVLVGGHGPMVPLMSWIRGAGPVEIRDLTVGGLFALSPAVLGPLLAIGITGWLLRAPVTIRPGIPEWPMQAAGLALLAFAGWGLAWLGGEGGVPNGVSAVEEIWHGFAEGRLWLRPSLLAGVGLLAYGVSRGVAPAARDPGKVEITGRAAAGVLLGLSSALAGGDPAAHAIFGCSRLALPSMVYVVALWCGGWLMGLLEWKTLGRPGSRPSRGHGV